MNIWMFWKNILKTLYTKLSDTPNPHLSFLDQIKIMAVEELLEDRPDQTISEYAFNKRRQEIETEWIVSLKELYPELKKYSKDDLLKSARRMNILYTSSADPLNLKANFTNILINITERKINGEHLSNQEVEIIARDIAHKNLKTRYRKKSNIFIPETPPQQSISKKISLFTLYPLTGASIGLTTGLLGSTFLSTPSAYAVTVASAAILSAASMNIARNIIKTRDIFDGIHKTLNLKHKEKQIKDRSIFKKRKLYGYGLGIAASIVTAAFAFNASAITPDNDNIIVGSAIDSSAITTEINEVAGPDIMMETPATSISGNFTAIEASEAPTLQTPGTDREDLQITDTPHPAVALTIETPLMNLSDIPKGQSDMNVPVNEASYSFTTNSSDNDFVTPTLEGDLSSLYNAANDIAAPSQLSFDNYTDRVIEFYSSRGESLPIEIDNLLERFENGRQNNIKGNPGMRIHEIGVIMLDTLGSSIAGDFTQAAYTMVAEQGDIIDTAAERLAVNDLSQWNAVVTHYSF